MRYLFILLLLVSCCAMAQTGREDSTAIRKMLSEQVAGWNSGNVESYMHGYWQSDSLVFIGKNGPTYGYAATLARYRKAYPDSDHMGQLTSEVISMRRLSGDYYFVIGKWVLKRTAGDLSGSWTLLIRRIHKQWVIVVDHSS